ncbi:UNVERIFIED_CONTAM: Fatty acyl-CoA reductase 2 [Sesamum radiatum]|uniref:Fatty acyl-CoA reductase n=1 Tax=Sesamum radiatum TaxID=300843 RepID=A0AAW2KC02_SESRA
MNATTTNVVESWPKIDDSAAGIGILDFLQGKKIFITGATGFLGKAVVEKLLRSTGVGKIYVLIKAEDKANAFDRLKSEIINSELLKCLQEEHGASYEAFVKEKLIPVVGNVCEPELGMDFDSANAIMKEVDVIIQSAANTIFDDR